MNELQEAIVVVGFIVVFISLIIYPIYCLIAGDGLICSLRAGLKTAAWVVAIAILVYLISLFSTCNTDRCTDYTVVDSSGSTYILTELQESYTVGDTIPGNYIVISKRVH